MKNTLIFEKDYKVVLKDSYLIIFFRLNKKTGNYSRAIRFHKNYILKILLRNLSK